jgi:Flp pilus assembly pilin Flp
MLLRLIELIEDEGGQDLIEYALLTATIGLVGAASFDFIRTAIGTTYASWDTGVNDLWVPDDPSGGGA